MYFTCIDEIHNPNCTTPMTMAKPYAYSHNTNQESIFTLENGPKMKSLSNLKRCLQEILFDSTQQMVCTTTSWKLPSHAWLVWRCGSWHGGVKLCLILANATHGVSCAVSIHAQCCSIEGGATVAGGMAVSDVIGFQFLLQRHFFSDVSLARQMMMLFASILSLLFSGNIFGNVDAGLHHCWRLWCWRYAQEAIIKIIIYHISCSW